MPQFETTAWDRGVMRHRANLWTAWQWLVVLSLGALLFCIPAAAEEQPGFVPCIGTCDDWIVSVRDCPKKRTSCAPCDVAVTHLDLCGRQSRASLAELVASLHPGAPVCFVLHGSFVPWRVVFEECRRTQTWLREPCPGHPVHLVFFAWPSDETSKILFPIDVAVLGRRAGRHAQDVAQVIAQIPDDHPICIIGHSHGARMAAATLHLLAGGNIDGIACPCGPYQQHRIRAVLAAAAFDHDWLNPSERYDRAVYRPECVLNLRNRHDLALAFYPLQRPGAARSLARTGFTTTDRHDLGDWSGKLMDVDVTGLVGLHHQWANYLDEPAIARTLAPYVFFTDERSP
jgi:hypothetical protein